MRFHRTAVAAPGKSAEAMAFAAETHVDLAQFAAVNGQQMTNQEYMEKVVRGEQLFVAGLGEDTLVWTP